LLDAVTDGKAGVVLGSKIVGYTTVLPPDVVVYEVVRGVEMGIADGVVTGVVTGVVGVVI
jgi:hypothetical protein